MCADVCASSCRAVGGVADIFNSEIVQNFLKHGLDMSPAAAKSGAS